MEKLLTRRNTLIFVGLLTLWRVYLSATLQLHPDEAYYWLWSRHLQAGYFDHGPLVGFVIWLTTLLGQTELWVRFSGILGSLVMSVLSWRLAMQMFSRTAVAAAGVLLLNIYPLTMSGSIIITPDIPMFLFWSLAVYAAWQVVRTQKAAYWYWAGLAAGLALLSKYTAVLLAPCLLLFFALTEERRWLKTPHPYLAALIALAMFSPVVWWNAQHGWISFAFQFGHGLGGQSYSLGRLLEYIGGQMLVAGPVAWAAGAWALAAYLFRRDKARLFLCMTALPVLLFFGYSSLKKTAGPNWPAMAYFTFGIALAEYFLSGGRGRRRVLAAALATSFGMSLLVTLHARFAVLPLARFSADWEKADATSWFYGWKELGREIEKDYPDARYAITPSHQMSPEVAFYTGDRLYVHIDPVVTRFSQFNLWPFPAQLRGARGLYIFEEGRREGPWRELFERSGEPRSLTVYRNGSPVRTYRIIPVEGFKGEAGRSPAE